MSFITAIIFSLPIQSSAVVHSYALASTDLASDCFNSRALFVGPLVYRMPRCSLPVTLIQARRPCTSTFSIRTFRTVSPSSKLLDLSDDTALIGRDVSQTTAARYYGDKKDTRSRIDAEHSALIDPNSLRNTLDAVRAANRTALIRKTYGTSTGERLSLPNLLNIPLQGLSTDAAIIEAYTGDPRVRHIPSGAKESTQRHEVTARADLSKALGRRHKRDKDAAADQAVSLLSEWEIRGKVPVRYQTPWLASLSAHHSGRQSSAERLSDELHAFDAYSSPSVAEKNAAAAITSELKHLANSYKPDSKLNLFGSRASGVASALSDFDVILTTGEARPTYIDEKTWTKLQLHSFNRWLSRTSGRHAHNFQILTFVVRASVPVILLKHRPSSLDVQVSCADSGYVSTEYAKYYLRENPTLQIIFRALRQTLAMRGLDDGQVEYPTSYPLLMFVAGVLRSYEAQGGPDSVAHQLLYVLQFFAETDFAKSQTIAPPFELVRQSGASQSHMFLEHGPGLLIRYSPQRMLHVQRTMRHLRNGLVVAMEQWDAAEESDPVMRSKSIPWGPSLLSGLLKADYRMMQLSRAVLVRSQDEAKSTTTQIHV
jgi:hypothetical protein